MKKQNNFILNLVEKQRKKLTFFVLLITIVIIICCFTFSKNTTPVTSMTRLEIAKSVAEIISAIFVIVGSFVAVSQYWLSSRSERIKMDVDRINKGIELADFYKENVIKPYTIIKKIYKDVGLFDILKKEKERMQTFTNDELTSVFSEKEIKSIDEIRASQKFIQSLLVINDIFGLNINGCDCIKIPMENGEESIKFKVNIEKALTDFYSNYVSDLLNNVELFAMYFTHNVADESVVYQSLYPTYIELCQTLYYDISVCSVAGKPMLYRNLNKLYLIWLEKMNNSNEQINNISVNMGCSVGSLK